MKKTLILMMVLSSTILFTGCESKTDKLENKLNELESTVQDMSTSTTSTTIPISTEEKQNTQKKTTSKNTTKSTTTASTTIITIQEQTTTTVQTTMRRDKCFYDEEGPMPNGYMECDSNGCKCFLNNGKRKNC